MQSTNILEIIYLKKKLRVVNIKDVAHHVGHSSTQVTEKYLHSADKQLAAQVNSLEWSADIA